MVWEKETYVAGDRGLMEGTQNADSIIFEAGSGHYSFTLTGQELNAGCAYGFTVVSRSGSWQVWTAPSHSSVFFFLKPMNFVRDRSDPRCGDT